MYVNKTTLCDAEKIQINEHVIGAKEPHP